jgi:VWFA-related protein
MYRQAFLLLLVLVTSAAMQLQEEVNIDLVEVYVSALDSHDLPVLDLSESDFTVKEDDVVKKISYFTRLQDADSQIPLTIAFLVDTSGSMSHGGGKLKRIDIARNFASLFLNEVKPSDNIRIFAFDNVYRPLTPMTSDINVVKDALSKVEIDTVGSPGTALLASVDITIRQLDPHFGRKIIIICSDGQNNINGPSPEILLETLKKKDITVLSLTTVSDEDMTQMVYGANNMGSMSTYKVRTIEAKQARKLMKELAEETGGFAFFPKNDSKLNESIQQIRSILRSQYVLSYKPELGSPESWREIEVKCKRKGIKLKYRKGYYMQ